MKMKLVDQRVRLAVAVLGMAVLMTGCSSDIHDATLSEMSQPEYAKAITQELTADDRRAIAHYVATHNANGYYLDDTVTIGEILEGAAQEKAKAVEAETAAMAELAAQQKAAEEARQARINEFLDTNTVALWNSPSGYQIKNEIPHLFDIHNPMPQHPRQLSAEEDQLMSQYIDAKLADDSMTLREVLDQVRKDPAGIKAQIRAAEAQKAQALQIRMLLSASVVAYVRQPAYRQQASETLSAEDFQLLDASLPPGMHVPSTSPLYHLSLGDVLENARQGKAAQ